MVIEAPTLAATEWKTLARGVEINARALTPDAQRVLTPEALSVVADLHRLLGDERCALLDARLARQAAYDRGERPAFSDAVPASRGDWRIAPLPEDLLTRRVEITGPVSDAKMVINMLSRTDDGHRADAAMLDFEDSMKPSWGNVVQGVLNVIGAVDGTLSAEKRDAEGRVVKTYALDPEDMPLLMVRVRGLHLDEINLRVDGEPVSAGLLDLALVAFHTARELVAQGKTPKYYVPKTEHHLEARWWNRLFSLVEDALQLPRSTMRATFLIETLPAAYQMEEILFELREHAAGLNGGRWDKIFSDIKVLRYHEDRILADRASIGMNRPWMERYARQLIRVCHKHGAFGMGGMAAFTPGKDAEARERQTRKVVEDKEFEASIGHDGCWVSHPYFIEHAMRPFRRRNQLDVMPHLPAQPDLMPKGTGLRTLDGLRTNVRVGIAYMKGWNEDIGCVAWDGLMEDLATLEISRAQTWQWLHHRVVLECGTEVTPTLVEQTFADELAKIEAELQEATADAAFLERETARYRQAARDARAVFTEAEMRPFLCLRSDLAGHPEDNAVTVGPLFRPLGCTPAAASGDGAAA